MGVGEGDEAYYGMGEVLMGKRGPPRKVADLVVNFWMTKVMYDDMVFHAYLRMMRPAEYMREAVRRLNKVCEDEAECPMHTIRNREYNDEIKRYGKVKHWRIPGQL